MISPTYSRGYTDVADAFACWYSRHLRELYGDGDGSSSNRPSNPNARVLCSSGDENEGSIVASKKGGGGQAFEEKEQVKVRCVEHDADRTREAIKRERERRG